MNARGARANGPNQPRRTPRQRLEFYDEIYPAEIKRERSMPPGISRLVHHHMPFRRLNTTSGRLQSANHIFHQQGSHDLPGFSTFQTRQMVIKGTESRLVHDFWKRSRIFADIKLFLVAHDLHERQQLILSL